MAGAQDPYRDRAAPAARPAPRALPRGLRTRLGFGGAFTQALWMTSVLVLGMAAGFVRCADLDDILGRGAIEERSGVVTGVEETSMKENRRRIQRVEFEVPGHTPPIVGTSYTTDRDVRRGDEVVVEIPVDRPERVRIAGMRRAPFGPLVFFIFCPWILSIAVFAVMRWRRGVLDARLLVHGRLAWGKLVRREETNVRVNRRRVIKLTFDFADESGHHHRVVARLHTPELLEDEREEPLVYDPARPARARLLDALPGRPRIGADGRVAQAASLPAAGSLLILPVLALVELVLLVGLVATR